ncbi:MAG: sugar transferase, PEP-CTERM/EpsH1 system associated [Rhodospirillales bacterium]|nr:sugar transferase, PEP-CTERM/EpsH1 system associated [Rhodospirillales bacterium]
MQELIFLTQRIPYPPTKGEKIRPWQILQYLRKNYTVHLGCFVDDPADWQHVPKIRELCGETYFAPLRPKFAKLACLRGLFGTQPLSKFYFRNSTMAWWVEDILARRRPEAAFICSSAMAQYVVDSANLPPRAVMDFADVDADKWRQYAATRSGLERWIYARESRTLLAYDRRVGASTSAGTFVSRAEAELFRQLAPELAGKIFHVDSGVDSEYFSPEHRFDNPLSSSATFVFTGTMNYWPNVDAVVWFATQVLPIVRRTRPDAEFCIVGSSPSAEVSRLAQLPGVRVTGRVADVRPYVAHAAAIVVPLRIANGVQNKVIEAMAMAKAVVATPRALAGVELDRASEVIVAESEAEFIDATLAVLTRSDRAELGRRARARVLADYRWEKNLTAFAPLIAPATTVVPVVSRSDLPGKAGISPIIA